jgi:hypothetical protein
MMEKLREALRRLGLEPSHWQGAGAIAKAMFKKYRTLHYFPIVKVENIPAWQEWAHYAFFGGRIEQQKALAHLREAQIMQSRYLAAQAHQQRASDPVLAAALALEALPDATASVDRPYVPEAELELEITWRLLGERVLLGHEDAVWSAAFSPDGKRIV